MGSLFRRVVAVALAAVLTIAIAVPLAVHLGGMTEWEVLPARLDPWAPLDPTAAPGLWTRYKLARLEGDGAACRALLASTALAFSPIPDRDTGAGCGFRDAVRVARSGVGFSASFAAACPLAAAWMLFETHTLQPAARRHLGQEVVRVRHLGSYACRNVYGRAQGRRSQHATANAFDVAAFVLADGTTVSVAADWDGDGARAAFLRAVRDGACDVFGAVLGPDHNAAHRDHFHLDRGPYRVCR